MRMSGVHYFHSWRVFPKTKEDGTKTFTLSIDGKDFGKLEADNIYSAIKEAEHKVEEMMEEAQNRQLH
jgi:hypothetical protein